MQPLAIVKYLDKRKGLAPGFVPCLERAVMHQLVLQRAEEALRDGVIVAVPPATHTGHQPMLGEDLPIGRRGIVGALIRVVNQARLRPAVEQGHREGVGREGAIGARLHRPADHAAGVQIQHDGQIQPARARRNRRDVPHPHAIRRRNGQPWSEMIGGWRRHLMVFGHNAEAAAARGFEALQAAQASHSMFAARNAGVVQRPPQLDRPVHAARLVMQAYNLGGQQAIRHGPGTRWAGQPTIEATATHSQDPTHSGDPKLPLVIPNEGVLHGSSLAKYAAAFFKMSRSSLSRAFSRRSRMTSSSAATGCPDPGNAWPPAASSCAAHLYSRLRGTPNSRANSAAGRPDCFSNRTASSLNSLVNRWRWPIVHLPGHCVPIRGVRQTRASSACPPSSSPLTSVPVMPQQGNSKQFLPPPHAIEPVYLIPQRRDEVLFSPLYGNIV